MCPDVNQLTVIYVALVVPMSECGLATTDSQFVLVLQAYVQTMFIFKLIF